MSFTKQNSIFAIVLLALLVVGFPFESFAQKGKKKTSAKSTPKATPKSSKGDQALEEGIKLFQQGTAETIGAALDKFADAAELYESENDSEGVANSYVLIGRANKKLNRFENSFTAYQKAFDLYESKNIATGKANALNNMGGIARDLGKFEDGLKYYQMALDLMRSTNDKRGEAQILNGMGECYFSLGNVQSAMQNFQQSNAIWQSLAASEEKVRTTYNMGRISFAFNDLQQGLNYLNQALGESRKYDNPVLEGDILEFLASYHLANGELTKAIEYRRRIFDAYRNAKAFAVTPSRVLISVNSLVVSYYRAGDFENAYKYLEDGIAYGTKNNEKIMTALLYGNKGVLLVDQGNYDQGMDFLNQGIESSRQTNNKMTEAYFLASLGFAHYEIGEEQEGVNSLNQALQIVPAGSAPEVEGKIISGLIRVYAGMENKGKTQEMIRLASSRKLDAGINAGTVQVLAAAGYAEGVFGNNKESLRLLNLALSVADKLNHEVEKAKILYDISTVYTDENNHQTALQAVQTSHDFWKKIGNQSMDLETHYQMGLIYTGMDQDQGAMDNFKTVLGFPEDVGMVDFRASSNLFLGLIYSNKKDFQSSLEHYNQALTMFESLDDKNNQKTALNGIADVYEEMKDKKKAKEYRDKVKKIKN